ncbi:MAG TPA: hypothetical protein PKE37_15090 [Thiomonas arsenitoxydans]|uniref:hypothetical protein n=1 Tax=Thiomonas arsenitoxydans (strain DSM 22701 / CIP 110005 / 3As) TaxID=426114 RepID=UPI002C65D9AA|nr:hypothetical protein [Thiomonas arsenitoxydans]HML83081.1 hypothetical protein [Thiomonas arsenitoxydans]
MTDPKPRSTAEVVLGAIEDLHAREQIVTREILSELTGLKLTTIDDRLGHLVDTGKIRRVQRGVFVPLEQHRPARPISRTLCPDGTTVLEVGDTVMILSPRESRMIGELMAGSSHQYAAIEIGHETARLNAALQAQISDVRREVARMGLRAEDD